jgi:hypothetical protein
MADLVDALLARPGLYVGSSGDPTGEHGSGQVARIQVSPLPGRSGVVFDYEVLAPDGGLNHVEHAMLMRTTGGLVLTTAHNHADVSTVIPETESGYFLADGATAPFPSAIRVEVPEPGHLVYTWSYGWGDEPLKVRDIADVRLVEGGAS